MTAHKPGTVTQQPMHGCTGCYELRTFHASDLRVHDDECWCYLCWDVYKEAELGIEYADLPAYDPSPQPTPCVGCEGAPAPENSPCAVCGQKSTPDVGVLVEALELISNTDPDDETAWFHEVAHKALTTYRKGSDE